jgi:hypothetical protein
MPGFHAGHPPRNKGLRYLRLSDARDNPSWIERVRDRRHKQVASPTETGAVVDVLAAQRFAASSNVAAGSGSRLARPRHGAQPERFGGVVVRHGSPSSGWSRAAPVRVAC